MIKRMRLWQRLTAQVLALRHGLIAGVEALMGTFR